MADRAALLRSLIALDRPLREVRAALRAFPGDAPRPLATLAVGDVVAVVERHLAGEFSG